MVANRVSVSEPVSLDEEGARVAAESGRRLSRYAHRDLKVEIVRGNGRETITLPAAAVQLLVDLLVQMAAGKAVTMVPVDAELTTQQAADLLGVSRPFLIKLTKEKKIPCRQVGAHRRLLVQDLIAYKRRNDQQRLQALGELARQAQELGMGY